MMKKVLSLLLVTVLCMAYASALADSYSDMLEKAATYVATEDYTKAIASYQLAQKLRPQDEIAFLGEANVHILLENYIAASTAISAAIDINPVSPEAWTEKCRVDALFADISTFEQDVVFAEVCEADLSEVYLPAASMYAAAGIYEKAVPLFEMCNLNDLNDDQKEQYRRALVLSGDREKAENLGLATVTARNKELDAAFDADHLMLVKAELPTVAAENFEFPEELWAAIGVEIPENPIAEVASAISGAELTWLSLSPEGNSGILVANDTTSIGYYKGKFKVLSLDQY